MEAQYIEKAITLEKDEPFSKALHHILAGKPVIVVDGGEYLGVIDDRNIRFGIKYADRQGKVSSFCVKAPAIDYDDSPEKVLEKFLAGHYRALPVVRKGKVVGILSRIRFLKLLFDAGLVPNVDVSFVAVSPVYTIDANESVASAKRLMKQYRVKRLTVMERNHVVGEFSSFDLAVIFTFFDSAQKLQLIPEKRTPEDLRVREIMRRDILVMERGKVFNLHDVVKEMINKQKNAVILAERGRPVSIVTVRDVLKFVSKLFKEERVSVIITGLRGKPVEYAEEMVSELKKEAERYKSLNIREIHLVVKESKGGKERYEIYLHTNTKAGVVTIKVRGKDFVETFAKVLKKFSSTLRKLKDRKVEEHIVIERGEPYVWAELD